MTLSQLLDSVPQVPQPTANHIIYGGILSLLVSLIAIYFHLQQPWAIGVAFVFLLTAIKKYTDYGRETLFMCVGKTLVTPVFGYVLWAVTTFYIK